MMMPPSSFQDYENRILAQLKSLTPKRVLAFSIWCASRLMESADVRTCLPESDVNLLEEIVAVAWSWVGDGTGPIADQVADLGNRLRRIGPSDPEAALELDPRVIETLSCVEAASYYYLTGSVEHARGAAECLINLIDYESEDQISLETMFDYPPMRAEFERQLKMIDCLRTATLEGMSLQQLRSSERFFD